MPDLDAWGIQATYQDASGSWRKPPPRTIEAVTHAMGIESDQPPPGPPLWIVAAGEEISLGGRWELHADDDAGSDRVGGTLRGLDPGYYWAYNDDGRGLRIIVTPRRCYLPDDLHTWGWAVQLYAMRSHRSWGMGDLGDLASFAASIKPGVVLVNPLHASSPVLPQEPSPYFPSSRCFRNPLYIRIEDVPGASFLGDELESIARVARALNDKRRVDRDEVFRLKMDALTRIFAAVPVEDPSFGAFVAEGGDLLQRYATYCVVAERYGPDWRQWPSDYRHPSSFGARQVVTAQHGRVRFHQWLQWLVDRQLERAGEHVGLMQDLAIGVDPSGADAWMWQDVLASDITVGAPPDEYNPQGQDWAQPPFDPWKLRDAAYEPFIQTVRAGFRHAAGLRFDHVMGLFRLFWIPAGASARAGTYVRYPAKDLLDILAVESYRARAYVVGEDLGTVEQWMRDELAERRVMSYRLVWFEQVPPREFPVNALAAITTHDLPTIAGVWERADRDDTTAEKLRERIKELTGLDDDAPVEQVILALHKLLAEAPSRLVTATIDDALAVPERPNYPGTIGDTNWSLALPKPLEEITTDERVTRIAAWLRDR
jgi:4-alpha-glucanotransferase